MKLIDSPMCSLCPEIDNLVHFFCKCNYVNTFWNCLFDWLNNKLNYNLVIDEKLILFGENVVNDYTFVANFIILHAKLFIYRNRVNNNHVLSIISFKALLKRKLEIERTILSKTIPEKFIKFQRLLDEL